MHVHSQREPCATKFRVKLLRSQSPERRDPAARPSSGLHINRSCGESCLSPLLVSVLSETAGESLSAWTAATGHKSVGTHTARETSRDQSNRDGYTCSMAGDSFQIRRPVEWGNDANKTSRPETTPVQDAYFPFAQAQRPVKRRAELDASMKSPRWSFARAGFRKTIPFLDTRTPPPAACQACAAVSCRCHDSLVWI